MRQLVRSGLVASAVLYLSSLAGAQTAAPAKGAAAQPKPAEDILSTVNGEPINRAEFYGQYNAFGIPPGSVSDAEVYRVVLEGLTNHKLVEQYLVSKKIPVADKDIDAEYNNLAEQVKKEGRDINVALASAGLSVAQVRDEMKKKLMWRNYIRLVATDEALKKYMAENKDVFSRTLVKASHIVTIVDPHGSAADKEKARAKLVGIKKEIDSKKISFADAANQYSEDQQNKTTPTGGDLGFFPRRGGFEPQFSAAAFALKEGVVSDPVETPFGYHLILVTERKAGKPVVFEQEKLQVQEEYMADLQERIVREMRKTAKIEVKPLPGDLLPKAAPEKPATGATEAGKASASDAPKPR